MLPRKPVPPAPTTAAPGTDEKMAVLVARLKAGFAVFHPLDARYPDDQRTLKALARLGPPTPTAAPEGDR